jgi:hypothetical protein
MKHVVRFLLLGVILLGVGTAVACNTADEATEPAAEEPTNTVEVPEEVMVVREAALEHLRTIAQIMVPPESTPWQSSTNDDFAETGTSVYLFSAEDDKLSISYPSRPPTRPCFMWPCGTARLIFAGRRLLTPMVKFNLRDTIW